MMSPVDSVITLLLPPQTKSIGNAAHNQRDENDELGEVYCDDYWHADTDAEITPRRDLLNRRAFLTTTSIASCTASSASA